MKLGLRDRFLSPLACPDTTLVEFDSPVLRDGAFFMLGVLRATPIAAERVQNLPKIGGRPSEKSESLPGARVVEREPISVEGLAAQPFDGF